MNNLLDFPESFVIFDIETTGLNPLIEGITEISAIKVCDNKVVDTFSTLINPEKEISSYITELTGITNEMVENEPTIHEVIPKFIKFLDNNIIIGHNVGFDISFIQESLRKLDLPLLTNDYVDTLRLSRKLLKQLSSHKLGVLAEYYGIDTTGAHRSMKDTEMTLTVYYKLEEEMLNIYGSVDNMKNNIKRG